VANKLSHSAIGRYKMCGENYRLHYQERIRPNATTGPLIFGAALDNALNVLLTDPNGSAEQVFEQYFTTQKINGKDIHLPTSTQIIYHKADYDADLITEIDVKILEDYAKESGLPGYTDHLSAIKEIRKKKQLTELEQSYLNFTTWLCMFNKGKLMIKAYKDKVLPHLTVVHEVQREFSLTNGSGDSIIGLVDLIADVEGHGTVILDNKTAGRPYDRASAKNSEQLGLYLHVLEEEYKTRKVGYIVLLKNVIKNKVKICTKCGYNGSDTSHSTCSNMIDGERCHGEYHVTMSPEIGVQIIVDDMAEDIEATVIAEADVVNTMINDKQFNKNTECCEKWYGSRCPYFDLCHNQSMKGLVKL